MSIFSLCLQDQAVYLPTSAESEDQVQFIKKLGLELDLVCPYNPIREAKRLPSIRARRMSRGTRLACEAALCIASQYAIDAWIFASQYGESSRGIKILESLMANDMVSPTDFMMSVHNAASGMFTIENHFHGSVTSLAAGGDTFHMALLEAAALLGTEMSRVAVVEFDDVVDSQLCAAFNIKPKNLTYATTWVLEKGNGLKLNIKQQQNQKDSCLPASLQAISSLAQRGRMFETVGERTVCQWELKCDKVGV